MQTFPKVYIVDFQDSFTYNIAAECFALGYDIEVISFTKLKDFCAKNITKPTGVVLGPGPGSPDEYKKFNLEFESILSHRHLYILGLCLGHQILLNLYGFNTAKASQPMHGRVQSYTLDAYWKNFLKTEIIEVQRYNSLAVQSNPILENRLKEVGWEFFSFQGEIIMAHHKRIISYQFHPESIGTSFPNQFFAPFKDLLL